MYPTQKMSKPPLYVEKFNIQSLEDQSTRQLYENRLKHHIANKPVKAENIEISWEILRNNIHRADEEAIGKKKLNINGKPNMKPWFTEEVEAIAEAENQAFLKTRKKRNRKLRHSKKRG